MKIKNSIKNAIVLLGLAGLITSIHAENFMRGVRGPTNWQFDTRLKVSEQENNTSRIKSFSDSFSIRYWNGNKKGIFGYIAIPFKVIDSGINQNEGFGDLGIGIGPRGTFTNSIGSFHYISTIGLQLPSGDDREKPKLGSGRTDLKFSIGATYLTPSQKTEVDISFDYLRAEKDASDDFLFGIALGHQFHKKVKIGAGFLGNIKYGRSQNGEYKMTGRCIARYNHSKRWHSELWLDKGILDNRNEATLVFRYNF